MKYCGIGVEVLAQVVLKYQEIVWQEYELNLFNFLSVGRLSMQNWLTQRKRSGEDKQYPLPYVKDEKYFLSKYICFGQHRGVSATSNCRN